MPARIRTLVNATRSFGVRRTDDRTLVLRSDVGLFSERGEKLFRAPEEKWTVGQRTELTRLDVEVLSLTPKGFPSEIAFRFAVPLEDPSLRLFYVAGSHMHAFVPPAVGQPERRIQPALFP